jgi:TRAP-type mannitol/chloroaromatic compound transport system substrate-binding protein
MKRGIVGILVMVMVLSCCLVGCGGQEGNADGDAVNTPQEKIVWKVQGYTPAETLYDFYGSRLAENITTMSQGRLTIEWYPADTIVPSVDGPQAVRDGVLDAVFDYSGMWSSIEYAAPLFCSSPGLFSNPADLVAWIDYGGGRELYQELGDKIGVHIEPAGVHDMENFLWANKPIDSIEALKSVKLRMMPIMGEILAANGCNVVFMSAGEIVPSMERGVIDAGEYSIPALDETFGFQDVAQYYMRPGFHQPTATQQLAINQKKWDELPDDLKRIVQVACKENQMYMMNDAAARSIDAMKRFEEMGKTLVVMPPEMLQTLQEWTDAWYEEKVKEDPYLARIRESQVEFLKWWAPYSQTKHMDYPAWALGE